MNICIDMMGGDYAPLEPVKGIKKYLSLTQTPVHLILVGNEDEVLPLLQSHEIPTNVYTMVDAKQVIEMNEHPTKALKEKPNSSIAIGFHLLAAGKADAFISAGNTGAMLVGTMYSLKPIEGVIRPTISTIVPKENNKYGLLLDVGLNADCKPEHLNQFAIMGSVYAKIILGIDNPKVALINVGEEEGKGNKLAQATYELMKTNSHINFIGNVEGRDLFEDKADVIVTEGFTGNIILKMAESFYTLTQRHNINNDYFEQFHFENYGGTPVLGVAKPVIIGHGISRSLAFNKMIELAEKITNSDLMKSMEKELR